MALRFHSFIHIRAARARGSRDANASWKRHQRDATPLTLVLGSLTGRRPEDAERHNLSTKPEASVSALSSRCGVASPCTCPSCGGGLGARLHVHAVGVVPVSPHPSHYARQDVHPEFCRLCRARRAGSTPESAGLRVKRVQEATELGIEIVLVGRKNGPYDHDELLEGEVLHQLVCRDRRFLPRTHITRHG